MACMYTSEEDSLITGSSSQHLKCKSENDPPPSIASGRDAVTRVYKKRGGARGERKPGLIRA